MPSTIFSTFARKTSIILSKAPTRKVWPSGTSCGYKRRCTQHLVICNILYEKRPLMQDPFSRDSRGKKRPVLLFHEPPRRIQQEVVPGHAPRTPWEDLVRRGRAIERRVLAWESVADLEDRRPVEGNRSVISG